MFGNLGWEEIALLVVIALFVFGPERLPKAAADAGRMLRRLREMATEATTELRSELGPEMADLDLNSLHPRRFVQKHLFEDLDDDAAPRSRPGPPATGPAGRSLAAGERPPYDPDAT